MASRIDRGTTVESLLSGLAPEASIHRMAVLLYIIGVWYLFVPPSTAINNGNKVFINQMRQTLSVGGREGGWGREGKCPVIAWLVVRCVLPAHSLK